MKQICMLLLIFTCPFSGVFSSPNPQQLFDIALERQKQVLSYHREQEHKCAERLKEVRRYLKSAGEAGDELIEARKPLLLLQEKTLSGIQKSTEKTISFYEKMSVLSKVVQCLNEPVNQDELCDYFGEPYRGGQSFSIAHFIHFFDAFDFHFTRKTEPGLTKEGKERVQGVLKKIFGANLKKEECVLNAWVGCAKNRFAQCIMDAVSVAEEERRMAGSVHPEKLNDINELKERLAALSAKQEERKNLEGEAVLLRAIRSFITRLPRITLGSGPEGNMNEEEER